MPINEQKLYFRNLAKLKKKAEQRGFKHSTMQIQTKSNVSLVNEGIAREINEGQTNVVDMRELGV